MVSSPVHGPGAFLRAVSMYDSATHLNRELDPVAADGAHVHPFRDLGDVQVIVPARRRIALRDIWSTLPVLRVIAYRDLAARFKQAALGPLWLFIQPLGMVGAVAVAFNGVTKVDTSGVPYILFALTGTCVWAYFQSAMSFGANAIVANGLFIKRVNCPRYTLPMAQLVVALPLLAITLFFTFVAMVVVGWPLTWRILLVPAAFLWLALLTWSVVAMLSSVAVRARDVLGLIPFVVQVGLFVTPVGYSASQAGGAVETLININPLTGIIDAWRWCLLDHFTLSAAPLLIAAGWTVLLGATGWRVFTRLEVTFADVV